ncbi:MAG TPA: aminotransferase class IV [Paludibacter sp.]|nr:aminotransferase class IV [Paludibacter sp.]
MCRFLESIQLNDGEFKRLSYHQARMDYVQKTYFPDTPAISLQEFLSKSNFPVQGLFKCRIGFTNEIQSIEFQPYIMRTIETLKLVEIDLKSTFFKSENREKLNDAFLQKGICDDVLLVKEDFLTDTSYCNIALFDGENWITPRNPLIYGVNRAELLENKIIAEGDVRVDDLNNYSKIRLFNAMIEFGDLEIEMKNIIF